jgi:hypothetical protein
VADDPKPPARSSLAAKLKALSEKAAALSGDAAPGAGPEAAPAPQPAPAAPPAAPAGPPRRSSLAAKLKALAAGEVAPAEPPPAAAPAPAAPAPAPAPPKQPIAPAPKPAAPAPAAKAKAPANAPPAAAPAPSLERPAAPAPAAPPPGTGGSALATDRIARRLRGEPPPAAAAPAASAAPAAGVAPAARPSASKPAPEPVERPRRFTPYVDDAIYEKLPPPFQRILRSAGTEEGLRPVRAVLKGLQGPELERQHELLQGFIDNLQAVLRRRFLPEDIEKYIFVDGRGDLSLRYGDGEVKLQARCWEFFFLWRARRLLGRDLMAGVQALFAECFRFEMADTPICRMKVVKPVEFTPAEGAFYFEGSLELGGWCDMRFESGAAFSDGRVLAVELQPRVVRGKDVPPPAPKDPKEFVALLRQARRRG